MKVLKPPKITSSSVVVNLPESWHPKYVWISSGKLRRVGITSGGEDGSTVSSDFENSLSSDEVWSFGDSGSWLGFRMGLESESGLSGVWLTAALGFR